MNQRALGRLLARIAVLTASASGALGCSDSGGEGDSRGSGGGGGVGSGSGGTAGNSSAGTGGATPTRIEGCTRPDFTDCMPQTLLVDESCIATGGPTPEQCDALCGFYPAICEQSPEPAEGGVIITCTPPCAVGRKPSGWTLSPANGGDLGAYFAKAAELEGASVAAFRMLRGELRKAGAPRRLLRAMSRAARDEVRHERCMRALARRYGRSSVPASVPKPSPRSLEEVALENVVEGCVRETFGALVAHWQAEAARDPEVSAAFKRIARDETRHAALSWSIQRWLEPRIGPKARQRVELARRRAVRSLSRELEHEPPHRGVAQGGLPSRGRSRELLLRLDQALWQVLA